MEVLIGDNLPFSSLRLPLVDGDDDVSNLFGKLSIAGEKYLIRLRVYLEQRPLGSIIPIRRKGVLVLCLYDESMSADLPECLHEFVGLSPHECERERTGSVCLVLSLVLRLELTRRHWCQWNLRQRLLRNERVGDSERGDEDECV